MKTVKFCPYCGDKGLTPMYAYRGVTSTHMCESCRMLFILSYSRQCRKAPTKKVERNDTIPTT